MSDHHVRAEVERLKRLHNLIIVLVVVTALASAIITTTWHLFPRRPDYMWVINLACLILPASAMLVTGLVTNGLVRSHVRRTSSSTEGDALALYGRAKLTSMVLLGVCGMIAAVSLVIGHRVQDVALVLVPIALMLVTRPAHGNVEYFAMLIEMTRGGDNPASDAQEKA